MEGDVVLRGGITLWLRESTLKVKNDLNSHSAVIPTVL